MQLGCGQKNASLLLSMSLLSFVARPIIINGFIRACYSLLQFEHDGEPYWRDEEAAATLAAVNIAGLTLDPKDIDCDIDVDNQLSESHPLTPIFPITPTRWYQEACS